MAKTRKMYFKILNSIKSILLRKQVKVVKVEDINNTFSKKLERFIHVS